MPTERRTEEDSTARHLHLVPCAPELGAREWDEREDVVVDLAVVREFTAATLTNQQREMAVRASRSCHPAGSNRASSTQGKIA